MSERLNQYHFDYKCSNCQFGYKLHIPKGITVKEYLLTYKDKCIRCECDAYVPETQIPDRTHH